MDVHEITRLHSARGMLSGKATNVLSYQGNHSLILIHVHLMRRYIALHWVAESMQSGVVQRVKLIFRRRG